jgi:acetyl esterase/lipase
MRNTPEGSGVRLFPAILPVLLLGSLASAAAPATPARSYAYGGDRRQVIELSVPQAGQAAPLVLFIHGGGWSAGSRKDNGGGQAAHFMGKGYAWATVGYRLVPAVTVEDQAMDLARAIAWLDRRRQRLGLDTRRLILIGHSSGAQLAGLIATDPQWLKKAGVQFDSIRGVVSLDGAGIDVPGIMAAGAATSPFYLNAFGTDPERQARLSPTAHVGAPDAPRWLFVYDRDHNEAAGYFAERFADAGRGARIMVDVVAASGTSHMGMLRSFGAPGDGITGAVDGFVAAALAPRSGQ